VSLGTSCPGLRWAVHGVVGLPAGSRRRPARIRSPRDVPPHRAGLTGCSRNRWLPASLHLYPDSLRRDVTIPFAARSSIAGFLRRYRWGRLHHPASLASPPEGPTTAGHRGATWMSSPTSPRLRYCRSGRPARRPVRSLALYGWFCHTRMRALVERCLCSIQGPSMSARTFDRPTTHPTSEKVRRLVMPAETSSAVPSQEAGATSLRRGPCLDRAQDGYPSVALIAARGLPSAGRHRCRWASESPGLPCLGTDVLIRHPCG